jgi:hypothetical protein
MLKVAFFIAVLIVPMQNVVLLSVVMVNVVAPFLRSRLEVSKFSEKDFPP